MSRVLYYAGRLIDQFLGFWFQPVCGVDSPFDLFAVRKGAVMDVRELNYAKTVESFGKTSEMDAFMLDREHVRFGKRSAGDVRQANSQRPEGSFGSIGTAVGCDTSTLVPSNRSSHLFAV